MMQFIQNFPYYCSQFTEFFFLNLFVFCETFSRYRWLVSKKLLAISKSVNLPCSLLVAFSCIVFCGNELHLDGNTRLVFTIEVALRYDSVAALNCTSKVRACAQGIFN